MTSLPLQSLKGLGSATIVLLSVLTAAPAAPALPNADSYFHVTETTTGCENARALRALNAQGELLRADAQWINAVRAGGHCVTISPRSAWMFLWLEDDIAMMSYAGTKGRPGNYYIRADQLVDQNGRHPGNPLGGVKSASVMPEAAQGAAKDFATPSVPVAPFSLSTTAPLRSDPASPQPPQSYIAPPLVDETMASAHHEPIPQYIGAAAAAIACVALLIAGLGHFRSPSRRERYAIARDHAGSHAPPPVCDDWGMLDESMGSLLNQGQLEAETSGRLREAGWRIETQDAANGAAYVAARAGHSMSVHCIASATPIGVDAIQKIIGTDRPPGSPAITIVSNAAFTRAAQQVASARAVWTLRCDQLAEFDPAGLTYGGAANTPAAS